MSMKEDKPVIRKLCGTCQREEKLALSTAAPFRKNHYSVGSVISITFDDQPIRGWQPQALISTAQLKGGKMKTPIASLAATAVFCACGGGGGRLRTLLFGRE
jgi:hypothetical protein